MWGWMDAPLAPPPPSQAATPGEADDPDAIQTGSIMPMPPVDGPVLPVVPPTMMSPTGSPVTIAATDQVFAGPYGAGGR